MYVQKVLNNVPTRLITFGDPFNSSEVIIVITGSPGIPEFYTEFAQQLHRCTQLAVCVIGHAGHDEFDNEIFPQDSNMYNLKAQIEHKLDLINNFIDKRSKLHIVGHSLGGWLLLELLHNNDHLTKRISSINLLFPTLQKFAETKNGKFVNNFVRNLHRIILLFLFIVQLLPKVKPLAIKLYLFFVSLPRYYVKRISIYLNPLLQEKTITLAYECLDRVNELNSLAINKVKHLTNVVYALEDGWVPMDHIKDLKTLWPQLTFMQVNVDHAFVLNSSIPVANIVAKLIKDMHQ